eukprot:Nk52_evm14s2635 gene=Nk52_evmTU14s2635
MDSHTYASAPLLGEEAEEQAQIKREFNDIIKRAKKCEADEDLVGALKQYKKAVRSFPAFGDSNKKAKLQRKVEKLEGELGDKGIKKELKDEDKKHIGVDMKDGFIKYPSLKLCVIKGSGFAISIALYDQLFDYQREGVLWMWNLHQRLWGGVLGDDMGLGKTIQVVTLLSGLFRKRFLTPENSRGSSSHIETALVVVPVSLLVNWTNEIHKWSPETTVKSFYGSKSERERNLKSIQRHGGVCLTTYGTVVSNIDLLNNRGQHRWDYVILDEGHRIKNPSRKTTQALAGVDSRHRLILTGTPIQNNLVEMWSMFDFVCCGKLLGEQKMFKREYQNPIEQGNEKDALQVEKDQGFLMAKSLRELIAPHFLRREKGKINCNVVEQHENKENASADGDRNSTTASCTDQILLGKKNADKPKMVHTRKNEFNVWCFLTEYQTELYRTYGQSEQIQALLETTQSPLAALTVLKKFCDHPHLLNTNMTYCKDLNLPKQSSSGRVHELNMNTAFQIPLEELVAKSGKLIFLRALLANLKQYDHRVLVFSQSCRMLDIIQRVLVEDHYEFCRIDGSVKNPLERQKKIDLFNAKGSSKFVFLLTTGCGGVGITLTGADRVVIYDPAWNPAVDAQAVDRAYRIGQEKDVVVYRLVTCGTVEEKIYRKQVFKGSLMKSVSESVNPYRYFKKEELRNLFDLDDVECSETQKQLSQLHSHRRVTDEQLNEHIVFLESLNIFGISDHDLIYTERNDDDNRYISGEAIELAEDSLRRIKLQPMKDRSKEKQRYELDKESRWAAQSCAAVPDSFEDGDEDDSAEGECSGGDNVQFLAALKSYNLSIKKAQGLFQNEQSKEKAIILCARAAKELMSSQQRMLLESVEPLKGLQTLIEHLSAL